MVIFENLICQIKLWAYEINTKYGEKIKIEHLIDEKYYLHYNMETKHYLAELVVSCDGFRPYRYVEFVAFDLRKEDILSYAYCYYDDENSTETDIFNGLNKGIAYIINEKI